MVIDKTSVRIEDIHLNKLTDKRTWNIIRRLTLKEGAAYPAFTSIYMKMMGETLPSWKVVRDIRLKVLYFNGQITSWAAIVDGAQLWAYTKTRCRRMGFQRILMLEVAKSGPKHMIYQDYMGANQANTFKYYEQNFRNQ